MLTQTAANSARYLTKPANSITLGQRIERGGMGSAQYIVTGMPRPGYLTLGNCDGEDCDSVPESIVRSLPWRVLADVASADEVALATAAVAAKRSARKREQAAAAVAHTAAVARLKTEHPELEVGSCRATAAKNMRTLLKAAFPGTRFSVKQNTGSMVYSITVRWEGGPEADAVGAIVGRFQSSSFDGMTDSTVSHPSAWTDTFGGCSGVTMSVSGSRSPSST